MSMNELDGVTVLVVEDDPSLRLLCRVNLELEHYRVLEAADLDRATALLMDEPIDVVLLDLHVGDRAGVELVPLIRAERPSAGICLLSGTSVPDPPTIEGVDDFIRKPFDIERLTETVARLSGAGVGT
jgi:two-component system KDP operon response regulator KdpE